MPNTVVRVALGIFKQNQQILLMRRAENQSLGGYWLFPGGKQNQGESIDQTLHREIKEEIGLQIRSARPLIQIEHDYPNGKIELNAYLIDDWQGQPIEKEGPICWFDLAKLPPMPPANTGIIQALHYPELYWISPAQLNIDQIEKKIEQGIQLIQIRAFALSPHRLDKLLKHIQFYRNHVQFWLNSALYRPEWAELIDGLHLNRHHLYHPPDFCGPLAASCHDPNELNQAMRQAVQFSVLSPIKTTTSHPQAQPLGWSKLAEWIKPVNHPVYALGGLSRTDLPIAWQHGAQGIAGLSQI